MVDNYVLHVCVCVCVCTCMCLCMHMNECMCEHVLAQRHTGCVCAGGTDPIGNNQCAPPNWTQHH